MGKCSGKRFRVQVGGSPSRSRASPLDEGAALERHEGLIHAFIRRQGGGAISYEEALQAGRIGLWRALRGYDPRRGTTFATYAWVAICRQIHQRVRELQREQEVRAAPVAPAWSSPDPAERMEQRLVQEALFDLVQQLPEQLQRVIVCRYGLGDQAPCTLKQVGAELGVSGERVRQLQQEALAWLRHPARSCQLRQWVDKNTAADYRRALAQNAALRRARRRQP
jgi:RNA polymerase sigma factor (sigma-70 family)